MTHNRPSSFVEISAFMLSGPFSLIYGGFPKKVLKLNKGQGRYEAVRSENGAQSQVGELIPHQFSMGTGGHAMAW